MRRHETSEMNLTKGNLFRKIFEYTVPLMLTSIFQLLYTSIDLWTVSNFGGGSSSMSAVGSNGPLVNLLITLLLSISIGSGVTISIAKVTENKEKAGKILHTSYLIAIIGGIIFGLIGFFISPIILKLMKTNDDIIEGATTYLRIYFLGIPFLALVNFTTQMLRSLGDSKRPMWFLTISGLANVAFDLLFVIVFKMDVVGVALATVISWIIACVLLTLWFMKSKTVFVKFSFNELKIDKESLKEILKIGVPAGIQGFAFCLPNLLIQSSLYSIVDYSIDGIPISNPEIVAGSSAAAQIEGYIFAILDAFCVASIAFVSQNFGAKKKENMIKSYWYCFIWIAIFSAACFLISFLFYKELFGIFITEGSENIDKEHAILAGNQRLVLLSATYFIDGIMNLNAGYLKGMKKSLPPAIITLIGCSGTRILFLTTLFKTDFFHTVFWLYAAFPISWILVNIVYIPTVLIIQKKQFSLMEQIA